MRGMKIELPEETVKEAILACLQRTGLRATAETKVSVVSKEGEPLVVAVTCLEAVPAYIAVEPQRQPVTAPAPAPAPAQARAKAAAPVKPAKKIDVEKMLYGGQPAWPEAAPHLPDENGKIAMPDAGVHEPGQLDSTAVVTFDIKRFEVFDIPASAESHRTGGMRAYDAPAEPDDVPAEYRAGPSPVE